MSFISCHALGCRWLWSEIRWSRVVSAVEPWSMTKVIIHNSSKNPRINDQGHIEYSSKNAAEMVCSRVVVLVQCVCVWIYRFVNEADYTNEWMTEGKREVGINRLCFVRTLTSALPFDDNDVLLSLSINTITWKEVWVQHQHLSDNGWQVRVAISRLDSN